MRHVNNSIEELPVLSPPVAEAGKDDRVHQEQTAQKEWRQVPHVLIHSSLCHLEPANSPSAISLEPGWEPSAGEARPDSWVAGKTEFWPMMSCTKDVFNDLFFVF